MFADGMLIVHTFCKWSKQTLTILRVCAQSDLSYVGGICNKIDFYLEKIMVLYDGYSSIIKSIPRGTVTGKYLRSRIPFISLIRLSECLQYYNVIKWMFLFSYWLGYRSEGNRIGLRIAILVRGEAEGQYSHLNADMTGRGPLTGPI